MNQPFLNCYIWSVSMTNQPFKEINFFLVSEVYHYNSLTSGIINFSIDHIQIPEFEIQDIHLLDGLDYEYINKHIIPILCKTDNNWKIDLTLYENHKLQSSDLPSN